MQLNSIGPGIGGVCIEIGAGSGFWVDIFSDKHLKEEGSNRKKVTQVYGIEPNRDQHVSSKQNSFSVMSTFRQLQFR